MMETGYGKSQSWDPSISFPPAKKHKKASATGVAATKRLLVALQVGNFDIPPSCSDYRSAL